MEPSVVELLWGREAVVELVLLPVGDDPPAFPGNPPPVLAHELKSMLGLQQTPQIVLAHHTLYGKDTAAATAAARGEAAAAYCLMGSPVDARCVAPTAGPHACARVVSSSARAV